MCNMCVIGSVGLAVRSKHLLTATSPSKENTQISLLNVNAATVLSELGLSEEDSCPPPKSATKPTRRPSSSTHKVFNYGMT